METPVLPDDLAVFVPRLCGLCNPFGLPCKTLDTGNYQGILHFSGPFSNFNL